MGSFMKSLEDMKLQAKASGKRFASGHISGSVATMSVTGLAFKPSIIMLHFSRGDTGGSNLRFNYINPSYALTRLSWANATAFDFGFANNPANLTINDTSVSFNIYSGAVTLVDSDWLFIE